jgi:hypothetical protein
LKKYHENMKKYLTPTLSFQEREKNKNPPSPERRGG